MTYLFFDIECANSFGGIGKICSFGYVLCDENFSPIESDDLLMNPDAPFDWYLFSKNAKCRLAYSREEYNREGKFPRHYEKIKALLEAPSRKIFGFGCLNDVATITTECMRYDLPVIDFKSYDIHPALEEFYQMKGGLAAFVEKLQIKSEGMEFHDSKADAFYTMKVTEKLVADSAKSVTEIITPLTPLYAKDQKKSKIKKLYKNYLERKESEKSRDSKPPRPLKKVTVPKWFDYQRELLYELELQAKNQ
ncbi:MAG: hypothetical protein K5873_11705 [Treponema sp.]|nr:hypothetical protein [Treponema sp.]